MSELWGFQAGQQEAQQQQQASQLFNLKMEEGQQDLQEKGLAIQQAKATLDQQAKIMKAAEAKRAQRGTAPPGSSPIDTQVQNLFDYADAAIEYGNPVEASEIITKATTIQKNQVEMQVKQSEQAQSDLAWIYGNIQNVHDQASWQTFLMNYEVSLGHAPHGLIAQQNYNPQLVEAIKQGIPAQMEKAKLAAEQAKEKLEGAQTRAAEAEVPLRAAEAREHIDRAKSLEKLGVVSDEAPDAGTIGMVATGMPLTQAIPGYGKDAVAERTKYRNAAIKQITEENPDMTASQAGQELARRTVDFAAGKSSTTQLTKMLGATRQAVDQLDFNIDKTTEVMATLPSSNLSPILNAIARGEEKWTGNPAYSSLFFYMSGAAIEAARIRSGGQASAAQLHQGAMDEAKEWVDAKLTTPAAWAAVSDSMKQEGRNKVQTYEDAISKATGRVPPPPEKSTVKPPKGTVPADGTKGTSKSGKPIVVKDGNWVYQ